MDDTDLVGVLAEWCAIPSTVGDSAGAAEMRAAVAARLAATGALIRDHPLADGTHALVGRMRPEHTLQLLVVAHTDTPYGADHPVRRATREGDRLVGPGAAEMKGGIVVALAALAALETTADSGGLGWTLAVIPDGVHGAPQSGMLVRELARGAAVVAVMGRAAPGGEPVRSRMGVVRLRLVVRGRAAHGKAAAGGLIDGPLLFLQSLFRERGLGRVTAEHYSPPLAGHPGERIIEPAGEVGGQTAVQRQFQMLRPVLHQPGTLTEVGRKRRLSRARQHRHEFLETRRHRLDGG